MTALELQQEISTAYCRKPGKRWTYAEESALAELCRDPDVAEEWDELRRYQRDTFFPKSVLSLLVNWRETLDRYRTAPLRREFKQPSVRESSFMVEARKKGWLNP